VLTVLFDNLSPGPLWSSLGHGPSTSYTMHFFTQSSSSFCSTCPYHHSLICCNTNAMSSISILSVSSLLGNLSFSLKPHIHLTTHICSLKCHLSPYRPGLTSMQLLYNLPLIINDTSLLVSSSTNCLNLFQPTRILASTAASASPSKLSISPR